MALVNTKEMLLDAQKNHYAIGAFNVENMEMMQAVIAAAEAEKLPVILQTTPSTLKYADTAVFAAMAEANEASKVVRKPRPVVPPPPAPEPTTKASARAKLDIVVDDDE